MRPDPRSPSAPGGGWTDAYVRARRCEGRILTDAEVATLPELRRGHDHWQEWRQRADSTDRLRSYLRAQGRPLTVVDLGCGNGWLAGRMAALEQGRVVAVDANPLEIDQARRVFGHLANLTFVEADFLGAPLPVEPVDVVLLASVIQYVASPLALIERLIGSVAANGEIHVLDSPLYHPVDVRAARERTRAHYDALGVPEMAARYHHHNWLTFASLGFEVMYRPDSPAHRVGRRVLRRPRSPFPWLRFRADQNR